MKKQYIYPCLITMTAMHCNKRMRTVKASFSGYLGNIHKKGVDALLKKLRKPYLWYGCGYEIYTWNGRKLRGSFDPELESETGHKPEIEYED